MSDDKMQKARVIIAKILADRIFTDWENRTHQDVLDNLYKCNADLSLGINPPAVISTMVEFKIIFNNGTYNGEPFYSLKQSQEQRHL